MAAIVGLRGGRSMRGLMVAVVATLIIATPEIAQQSGNAAPAPIKLEDYVSSTASGDAAYSKGDYATALRLYRQLADRGNVSAQYVIGTMYFDGRGVPQVYATAALWFRKAAERGSTAAQMDLGSMYADGRGVPQDYVLAYKWLNLVATLPHLSSEADKKFVNSASYKRAAVTEKMTPAQIANAQKLAREWKPAP